MAGEREFFELGTQWFLNLLRGAGKSAGRAIASGARNAGRTVVAGAKNLPRAVARRAAVWGRRAGIAGMIGGGAWLLNSLFSGDEDKVNVVSGLGEGGLSSLLFGTAGSQMNIDKFRPSILKFNPVSYVDKQQQKSLRSHEEEPTEASNVNLLSSDTSLEYITNLIKLIIRKVDNQSQEIKQTKLNLLDVEDTATASVLISKKINEEQKEIAIATQAGINAVGKTVTKTNNTMTGILKAIKPTSVSDKWGGAAAGIVAAGAGAGGGERTADSGLSTVGRIVSTAAAVVGLPAALAAKASGGGMTGHEDHEAETPTGRLGQEAIKDLAVMGQFATYTFFNRTEAGAWIHGKILYISKELGNFIDKETNSDFGSKWAELGIDWALTAAFFESVIAAFHAGGLTFAERALTAGHFGRVKLTLNAIKIMETCVRSVNKAPVRLAELLYNLVFHFPSTVSSFFRTIVHPGNTRFANQIKLALKSTDDYIKAYSRGVPRARRMWNDFRWRHRITPPDVATPEAAPRPQPDAAPNANPKPTTQPGTSADGASETRQPSRQEPARTARPDPKPEATPRSTTDATPRAETKPSGPEMPHRPADPARAPQNRPGRPATPPSEARPSVATRKPPRVPAPPQPAAEPRGTPSARRLPRPSIATPRSPSAPVGGGATGGGWRAGVGKALRVAGLAADALLAAADATDSMRLAWLSGVRLDLFGDNAYSFPIGGIGDNPTWQERLDNDRTWVERNLNPFGHNFFAQLFQSMDDAFSNIIKEAWDGVEQWLVDNKATKEQFNRIKNKFNRNCYTQYADKLSLMRNKYWKEIETKAPAPFLPRFRLGADRAVEEAHLNRFTGNQYDIALRDGLINPFVNLADFLFVNAPGYILRHTVASDEFVDSMERPYDQATEWATGRSDIRKALEKYYKEFGDFIADYIEKDLLQTNIGMKREERAAMAAAIDIRKAELADVIGIQNVFNKIVHTRPGHSPTAHYKPKTAAGSRLIRAVRNGAISEEELKAIRAKMERGEDIDLYKEIERQTSEHANENITVSSAISTTSIPNEEKRPNHQTAFSTKPQAESSAERVAALNNQTLRRISENVDTLIERSDPVPPTRDTPDGGYMVS